MKTLQAEQWKILITWYRLMETVGNKNHPPSLLLPIPPKILKKEKIYIAEFIDNLNNLIYCTDFGNE